MKYVECSSEENVFIHIYFYLLSARYTQYAAKGVLQIENDLRNRCRAELLERVTSYFSQTKLEKSAVG